MSPVEALARAIAGPNWERLSNNPNSQDEYRSDAVGAIKTLRQLGFSVEAAAALEAAQRENQQTFQRYVDANEALRSCEAWIDRWTTHVGNCKGEDHRCTCGRAAVLSEARTALNEQTVQET